MTAKSIIGVSKYDSSTEALKTLHWFHIHLRIDYKVLTLVFRSMLGLAPNYLCDLIQVKRSTRSGLRSDNVENILTIPFTKHKTFADQSFSVYGPKAWNTLHEDLRSVTDYELFKSKLKTHMFQMY